MTKLIALATEPIVKLPPNMVEAWRLDTFATTEEAVEAGMLFGRYALQHYRKVDVTVI